MFLGHNIVSIIIYIFQTYNKSYSLLSSYLLDHVKVKILNQTDTGKLGSILNIYIIAVLCFEIKVIRVTLRKDINSSVIIFKVINLCKSPATWSK